MLFLVEGEPRSVGGALGASADQYQTAPNPTMRDRLNPLKDSDLDGKRGIMD